MSSKQKTNDPHRDLDTMSGAATDLFNRLPLTFKIMSWYTIFLLIILMVASAWIYAYTHESDNKEVRERLQQQAMIMATDIRKFKPYQDNTFFFVSTRTAISLKVHYQMASLIKQSYPWVRLEKSLLAMIPSTTTIHRLTNQIIVVFCAPLQR